MRKQAKEDGCDDLHTCGERWRVAGDGRGEVVGRAREDRDDVPTWEESWSVEAGVHERPYLCLRSHDGCVCARLCAWAAMTAESLASHCGTHKGKARRQAGSYLCLRGHDGRVAGVTLWRSQRQSKEAGLHLCLRGHDGRHVGVNAGHVTQLVPNDLGQLHLGRREEVLLLIPCTHCLSFPLLLELTEVAKLGEVLCRRCNTPTGATVFLLIPCGVEGVVWRAQRTDLFSLLLLRSLAGGLQADDH